MTLPRAGRRQNQAVRHSCLRRGDRAPAGLFGSAHCRGNGLDRPGLGGYSRPAEMSSTSTAAPRGSDAWFVTTHWSVVLSAREKDSPRSGAALETLCRAYWYPLYAFVRRQGHSSHDAQDLTQEFFARLLQKDYLQAAAREKGRFRTFLLVALKRFLANEWDRARAQKRGGGQVILSLDTSTAETRYQMEPAADAQRRPSV